MNLEHKTDSELQRMLNECRIERKRLLAFEREITSALVRRDVPQYEYQRRKLSTDQIKKIGYFVKHQHTPQEWISYLESLLNNR